MEFLATSQVRRIVCLLAEERANQVAAMVSLLSRESGIEVQIECVGDLESLDTAGCGQADTLILIDSKLLTRESGSVGEFTQTRPPSVRTIILLDDWPDMTMLTDFVLHGVSGCMLMSSPPGFYHRAMDAISSGELWFPRRTMSDAIARLLQRTGHAAVLEGNSKQCIESSSPQQLTEREQTIVALLRAGLTNKEIGRRLGISNETVKKHLGRVFRRLGVRNRTQLALETEAHSAG